MGIHRKDRLSIRNSRSLGDGRSERTVDSVFAQFGFQRFTDGGERNLGDDDDLPRKGRAFRNPVL
jgi:hypothetical protein